jgi:hypothetical protein
MFRHLEPVALRIDVDNKSRREVTKISARLRQFLTLRTESSTSLVKSHNNIAGCSAVCVS